VLGGWSYDVEMELSPKSITGVQFRTVRKGYDPEEVRGFLAQLARGIEAVQAQSAAADSRARSLMGKLQELNSREDPDPGEAMKRTLLLAQRTADAAVAEANEEARAVLAAADEKSRAGLAEAQAKAEQMITDAEADARRAASVEKTRIEAEVAALTARRDELHGEATRLEGHIGDQRERVSRVAGTLRAILTESSGLVVTELAPPSPALRQGADADGDVDVDVEWSDEQRRSGRDGDGTVAEDLAMLAEPAGGLFDDPGPPTAEVPVISGDDELVRGFFEPEPFADDRWKGRRGD
jgi:DivIVA domain-containing protein